MICLRRIAFFAILCCIRLSCVAGLPANELPDSPRPKIAILRPVPVHRVTDTKFWMVAGALGASAAADFVTTERMLARGHHEMNTLFGAHPSKLRVATVGGAYFAGEVILAYELKRVGRHHRWARGLWLVDPMRQTMDHIYWAASNEKLR